MLLCPHPPAKTQGRPEGQETPISYSGVPSGMGLAGEQPRMILGVFSNVNDSMIHSFAFTSRW